MEEGELQSEEEDIDVEASSDFVVQQGPQIDPEPVSGLWFTMPYSFH